MFVDFCYDNQITGSVKIRLPASKRSVGSDRKSDVCNTKWNMKPVLDFWRGVFYRGLVKRVSGKTDHHTGSRGVITCLKNGEILSVPARKANVADTTGAGDTLNGAFALQRAKGADMETALRYANVAASLSTEKFGAQSGMPMAQEVEEELEKLGGRA